MDNNNENVRVEDTIIENLKDLPNIANLDFSYINLPNFPNLANLDCSCVEPNDEDESIVISKKVMDRVKKLAHKANEEHEENTNVYKKMLEEVAKINLDDGESDGESDDDSIVISKKVMDRVKKLAHKANEEHEENTNVYKKMLEEVAKINLDDKATME